MPKTRVSRKGYFRPTPRKWLRVGLAVKGFCIASGAVLAGVGSPYVSVAVFLSGYAIEAVINCIYEKEEIERETLPNYATTPLSDPQ